MKHYFPEIKHIFIDLDGVLADLIGGITYLYQTPSRITRESWPPGVYSVAQVFGVTVDELWALVNRQGMDWWSHLDPLPWSAELLALIESTGVESSILTAPSVSDVELTGKARWIGQHVPEYRHRIHMTREKHLMAAPDRLLIDDHDENCQRFIEAGGASIVYPQPWNSAHLYAGRPLPGIINQLVEYGIIPAEQLEGSENGES